MSLNKKRPLAALYFAYRIIQRDFPLRAYVAPNVGDPFMGAHSFSSVNTLYLHGVRHPNLLTGACYQGCQAFVRYAIALSKDGSLRCPTRLRGAKCRRRRTAPSITGQSVRTYAAMRNRFMFPHAAIHHSRRSRQALQYLKSVRRLLVGNECTHPCLRRHPIVLSENTRLASRL